MVLLAEMMGCIFELRPFMQKDWNLLIQLLGARKSTCLLSSHEANCWG